MSRVLAAVLAPRLGAVSALVTLFACTTAWILRAFRVETLCPEASWAAVGTVALLSVPLARKLLVHECPVLVALVTPPLIGYAGAIAAGGVMLAADRDSVGLYGFTLHGLGVVWPVALGMLGACLGAVGSLTLAVPLACVIHSRCVEAVCWLALALWTLAAFVGLLSLEARWGAWALALGAAGAAKSVLTLWPRRRKRRIPAASPYRGLATDPSRAESQR